ncbi:hypothetical protein DFH28DRAFT_928266 [Melampsora americana]|nr:hypothetical protein DFH28DRAFT_928266 [Melampsora americana]
MVHISTHQKHWASQAPDSDEATVRAMFPNLFVTSPKKTTVQENHSEESSTDEEDNSPSVNTYTIIHHIMYFLAWMYLVCGVSQSNCCVARDYIVFIARMAFKAWTQEDLDDDILNDVWSITKRFDLHPTINSHTCCPVCYSLYDIEYGPPECGYQE